MIASGKEAGPAPEVPSRQGQNRIRASGLALLFMGVLLPLFTLGFEWRTHGSAEAFFDPIPTIFHILLIAAVPLANALLLFELFRGPTRHARRVAWLNAFAIGVALFYALLYLPLTPIAPIAVLWMGIGLLPIAPLLSLIAAIWGRRLMARLTPPMPPLPQVWGGLVLALAALIAVDLPFTLTRAGLQMAASDSAPWQLRGIRWLRVLGDEKLMLRLCYARSGMSTDLLGMLFNLNEPISMEQARTVFYQVTGTSFNDHPAPMKRGMRDWQMAFDEDRGGNAVGRRISGVSLASSRIDGSIDAQAGTGYLEWTMVFKNDAGTPQEGRGQIALPPGAVVSRVTLWIDGEEREAAFGGRAQVRQAYEKVVRQQRDPLLVTTAGRDRVMFQLFPIPASGGEMKIRIGMTVPMLMSDLQQSRLQLPSFRERNFEIAPALTHAVWLESKTPLESSAALVQEQAGARTYALRGALADTALGQGNAVITARRNGAASVVWSADAKAADSSIVRQRYGQQPAWMPQRAVLVIDGSRSMHEVKNQIADALAQFPPNVELGLVMAADAPQELSSTARLDPASAGAHIKQFSFEGGRDNLAALAKAWDWAGARPNGAIVWIHGPQPVLLGSAEPLLQRYERRPHQVRLYQLEAVAGANRLLEKLDGLPAIAAVPQRGSVREDLAGLFAQWQPGAKQIAVVRERLLPGAAGVDLSASMKTSDHIVRLWAAD